MGNLVSAGNKEAKRNLVARLPARSGVVDNFPIFLELDCLKGARNAAEPRS